MATRGVGSEDSVELMCSALVHNENKVVVVENKISKIRSEM